MIWLSRFVATVRDSAPVGPQQLVRLPDGRTNLIFRLHAGGRTGDLTVAGPRRRAYFKLSTGIARWLAIELEPGWAGSLLGVPATALTDRFVALHELWGRAGRELCDQLIAASPAEALGRISDAVAARACAVDEPAAARLARRAVRILETEAVAIDAVAARLAVTPRHLRRAFADHVGIGPKDFARAVRLRRVVARVGRATGGPGTAPGDWSRIAVDTGYYDQAHLIADFRELVGITPGAFAKLASSPLGAYVASEARRQQI